MGLGSKSLFKKAIFIIFLQISERVLYSPQKKGLYQKAKLNFVD